LRGDDEERIGVQSGLASVYGRRAGSELVWAVTKVKRDGEANLED
jgi:hypothetical protein